MSSARDDHYVFRVLELFDLNQNFSVDAPDAAAWINNPVDFDGDTFATSTDFNMLTEAMD